MLSTEEFAAFAKGVVPFLHVTSRVEGEAHPDLLGEKGGGGFPYVVAMDPEGHVTAEMDWDKIFVLDGMKDLVEAGKRYLERKADPDQPVGVKAALLRFDIKVRNVTPDEVRKAMAAMKDLTAEDRKSLDGMLLDGEVMKALSKARGPEDAKAAGKVFAVEHRAGRQPYEERPYNYFYAFILDYAVDAKDVKLFEEALAKLKERFGENPRAAGYFKKQDERLEKLREEKAEDPVEEKGGMEEENSEGE